MPQMFDFVEEAIHYLFIFKEELKAVIVII